MSTSTEGQSSDKASSGEPGISSKEALGNEFAKTDFDFNVKVLKIGKLIKEDDLKIIKMLLRGRQSEELRFIYHNTVLRSVIRKKEKVKYL